MTQFYPALMQTSGYWLMVGLLAWIAFLVIRSFPEEAWKQP